MPSIMVSYYRVSSTRVLLVIFVFSIDAEDGDVNQPFLELRNSLTSVVDAMRNFLTTIRVPELGNEADEDENESTDDGAHDDYLT